jgi:hypothetical protein
MVELSDSDVAKLFSEGYYAINCDDCGKPVGFVRVANGYDYTYDETYCDDCALKIVKRMFEVERNLYG